MASLQFPLACYAALAVAGVEVSAPGYTRQPVTLAYCQDGATISNLASAQWPHATQSWGVIDTVQVWDQVSGGRLIVSVPPNAPVLIDQYQIARIPASGFALAISSTADPRPYGRGGFGTGFYATYRVLAASGATGVLLQRDFDQLHVCAPGTWAPGPFAQAA